MIGLINELTTSDFISLLALVISLFLLVVHVKNRRTQLRTYRITRGTYHSGSIELIYVSSKQMEECVIAHLVVFNPSPIGVVIKSFHVERGVISGNLLLRLFGTLHWERIKGSTWWPTLSPEHKKEKILEEGYKELLVKDQRDILVKIPGMIDRARYRFFIVTNHGEIMHESIICGFDAQFPHAYTEVIKEK